MTCDQTVNSPVEFKESTGEIRFWSEIIASHGSLQTMISK